VPIDRAKAKAAVMRKFLRMLHSLTRSGQDFDLVRFRLCESQYAGAAQRPTVTSFLSSPSL